MALAAAGGLWAWRNRDKIQGWMNSQRSQLEGSPAMTGATRRIDSTYTPTTPEPDHFTDESYRSGI